MKTAELEALYADNQKCAESIGLVYGGGELEGYGRKRRGTGFSFTDSTGKALSEPDIRKRIVAMAIPPAWQEVWISADPSNHLLATGIDDKGRKQYMYHPKWRTIRDLLNFYRLMIFGEELPTIRSKVRRHMQPPLDRKYLLALMVHIIDTTYIRIGNDVYFEENNTVGLTTLTKKNVVVTGDEITLAFHGKSGKDHEITIHDAMIAETIQELLTIRGQRLFKLSPKEPLTAHDLNEYLDAMTGAHISAKNFRTWGGTLAAFNYLKKQLDSNVKPEKVVVAAVDKAAEELGNTRAVARSSYVHPHILAAYTENTFAGYYHQLKPKTIRNLDKSETELLGFLELLFNKEFAKLKLQSV